jgi:membrane-bound lytic murein transglycosylase D
MSNFSNRLNKVNSKEETFAVMDEILAKYGIPKELKYLAVIESALNGNARSRAGAVGYWQFMAPTARRMGLTVNRHRDDRKNLYKSTKAAAKYLSYLYSKTDDWLLTIAAYNSGLRPVLTAINRTGKNDFWSIKRYLPKETQNHVLAFVATATIMERLNPYLDGGLPTDFDWASLNNKNEPAAKEPDAGPGSIKHDLSRFSKDELQKMAIIRIKKPLSLAAVSSILSIDRNLLSRWNYDYYTYATAFKDGDTYNLRIPKDKLDAFIEKINIIENSRINNNY